MASDREIFHIGHANEACGSLSSPAQGAKKKDSLCGAFGRDSKAFDLNVRGLLTTSPAGCGPRRGPDVDPSLITEKLPLPPAVLELQTAGAWESRQGQPHHLPTHTHLLAYEQFTQTTFYFRIEVLKCEKA